jgi:hypothetical protein
MEAASIMQGILGAQGTMAACAVRALFSAAEIISLYGS